MFDAVSRAFIIFLVFAKLNYGAADICASPPPRVHLGECCDFPDLFDKSVYDTCGIQAPDEGSSKLSQCDVLVCVFKQVNMIKEEQKVDIEGVNAYLSKWSADNPEWRAQEIANKCFSDDALQSGPPDICQPMKVNFCVSRTFLSNCPAGHWTASEKCENARTYLQECQPH